MSLFLDDLVDFAQSTVTISPWASVDKNNQATYGAAVSYVAQVGGPVRFMHRESAQERISSQTVYLFTASSISARDQVTLPSGYDGTTTPKILQVDRQSDELGFCYTILYLG